ncbi:branched-chain amino acid ABC transporter permease [Desulfuromonas carbonis]|uniref:branched-chain amino acid ABC transporter permease n=1 Tax=Desulfuromonas sp. DDH964 TaxID=1823759 RepID=UPI00078E0F63|nr:branched-chain amino acid ABC transporter permease [Desulfuromonas sp. DDH964]AMV71920.1 branched-chain amino acid ABC transporter membrane protein [Desulfuromonas sp. DDH964]
MLIPDKTSRNLWIALAVLLVLAAVFPNWLGFITTVALAKGLVVLGLVLLMRTGLVSFGQGLYFCLGGYVVGIAGSRWAITDVALLLVISVLVALLVSALLGLLLSRYRDIFFAMLTMAFSMILYGVLVKSVALGSTDGFNIEQASLFGWHPATESLGTWVYLLTVMLAIVLLQIMHRYVRSPLGYAGEAIRENEIRVEYLGMSPRQIIYLKYVIAAVLAAVGGALTALAAGHVDPEMAFWTTSGEFVFIALLGGTAHVAAPLIGAFIFEIIRTFAFDLAPYSWQMILGGVLLMIIFFLPKGLWSLLPAQKSGNQS